MIAVGSGLLHRFPRHLGRVLTYTEAADLIGLQARQVQRSVEDVRTKAGATGAQFAREDPTGLVELLFRLRIIDINSVNELNQIQT